MRYTPAHPGSTGRLVYSDDAPAMTYARAVDPVDAGKRAILDRGGERSFEVEVEVERQRQRGADRAAMRDTKNSGGWCHHAAATGACRVSANH
jgi:hypothetical protein